MILTGIDRIETELAGQKNLRWAMVTNEVARTSGGVRSRAHFLSYGFQLVKLFSPEHGLHAQGADGEKQDHGMDVLTGLPVISLYGDRLAPQAGDLENIDAVLFDIPDVGSRFYTYLWTLTHVMEACALHQKPLVVLDRPNPIGGDLTKAEGPWLDESRCGSFIGRWSIPIRHSCTLGELARYFAATRMPNLDLCIIEVQNWNRLHAADEAGWDFRPTSPAIRDLETAMLYPGMGLLEGVYINEGRGTSRPFTVAGAPWILAEELTEAINRKSIAGVRFDPHRYIPETGVYAGEQCAGLRLSITDRDSFRPVFTTLELIKTLLELYPDQCGERKYYTAVNPSGAGHLDKLTGVANSFMRLREHQEFDLTVQDQWQQIMADYLIYTPV